MGIHDFTRSRNQAPWNIADPGTGKALPNDRTGTINIVTGSSGETNTLAAPRRAGIELAINMLTDGGGDRVITVASAINALGTTTITLNTAGDYYLLRSYKYGSVFRWKLVAMPAIENMIGLTATAAELNALDGQTWVTGAGAGITTGTGTVYKNSRMLLGGIYYSNILIDLTGLASSTTDLDIIGVSTTPAYLGRITAAEHGTILAVRMTCLELPAGGADDIDLWSAPEATGKFDDAGGTVLTEVILITAGAAWANGTVKAATVVPAPDDYIYLVGGEAGTAATYTAGKFLIEFFGY